MPLSNEDKIEYQGIDWFKDLGYEYKNGYEISPDGNNPERDEFRKVILENFNMSLGNGLSKLAGKVFRIGHLGDFNDLMLMGTLSGIEMGLSMAEIPHQKGGLDRAATVLSNS